MTYIQTLGGIQNLSDGPDIAFQLQDNGQPWPSILAAHQGTPEAYRAIGKIRWIDFNDGKGMVEYWYSGGIEIENLVRRYENLEDAQQYVDHLESLKQQAQDIYDDFVQIGSEGIKPQGEWKPASSSPDLAALGLTNTAIDKGKWWRVNEPGTSSITGASKAFGVGDGVFWNGNAFVYTKASDPSFADVQFLKGNFQRRNLANPDDFVDGSFVDGSTGFTINSAGYGHTGFIAVTPGTTYSGKGEATANGMRHVAFFNAAKQFLSGGYASNTKTFTVPNNTGNIATNVAWVIATYYSADKLSFQFEQGATPTSFVAYAKYDLKNTVVRIDSIETGPSNRFVTDTEKNAWNGKLNASDVAYDVTLGKNLFKISNVVDDNIVNTGNGSFSSGFAGWKRTGPVTCKALTTYTISGLVTRTSKAIRFEDSSGTFLSFLPEPSPITGTSITFSTPANAARMYINIQRSGETVNLNLLQIEEGAVATAPEPYAETSKVKSISGKNLPFLKINGKTSDGNSELILSKSDIGLGQADNTPDSAKPVSTLQQAALDLKLGKSAVVSTIVGKSKNLANPADFVDGSFIDGGTGFTISNSGYGRTGFIPVTPGLAYSGKGTATSNGMRHVAFYNAAKQFIAGGYTANIISFTAPADTGNVATNIAWIVASYYIADKSSFQFEQASSPTASVPYDPGTKTLVSVDGAILPGTPTVLRRIIGIADCDRVYFFGDSYSVGYNALPGKNYLSILSSFSDWNFDNYSKSGDATNMILARLIANQAQYKGVAPKQLKGGGYAVIISFTNDVNTSVINSTDQLNAYLANVNLLAEAAKALGYKPIIATEYHASTGSNGTGLLQAALSQFCEDNGYIFMDIYEKTRYLMGGTRFPYYWEGSHPGMRTNSIFWTNMLPYIKALPRPKWGIKIFRKRDFVTVAAVSDLMYVSAVDRSKKFKEILVTGQAMNSASYSKYDDQANWTSSQVTNVSEYYDLLNNSTITMGDYSLIEVVINSTSERVSKLDIKVGSVDAVYVKNHINQTWIALALVNGVVTLTDHFSQIDYDKISLLVVKTGGFNLSAPQVDFTGIEGKNYYQKSLPREMRTTELVSTPNFNSGTPGWTVAGAIVPFVPEDSASLPSGINQVVPISSGNYVSQIVNFVSASYKRKGQLKVIARRNPPRYSSANVFPENSPITLDSYDFANVKVNLIKGTNTITFKQVIGMHWTEVLFEFDVAAADTAYTLSIQKDDQDFELASISFKVE